MKQFLEIYGFLHPLNGIWQGLIIFIVGANLIYWATRLLQGKKVFTPDGKLDIKEKWFLNKFTWKYPLWGLIQEFGNLLMFNILQHYFPQNTLFNIIIVSAIFCFFHFPNILLMGFTFGMAEMFLIHYITYHNIYILAILHGTLGTILMSFSPRFINTSFQIWGKYIEEQNKLKNKLLK